ncbi:MULTISPECIES: DegV family protein [Atopobiaceae]|uniref:EDD domain protein, DegV family n=1 Tax=Parafannyhessea umbonata TaxID=604330 RepID=A0A1H6HP19_9ACTN|nr:MULTISPECIES: DegV family protein [Atopobiaceae]SEH37569.1 EDD domain protein, DegV family [Parafannyhessea umbonata]SJZ39845.1 EDD domain protein, DegV family [Olsenella sp. KH1P3]
MCDYILSCCSTADLTEGMLKAIDVECVYFNYEIDGIACKDDFGRTHTSSDLFSRMLAGSDVKTSQVSMGDYIEFWRPFLEQGKSVLHVTLSSGISGTYQSACMAAERCMKDYPGLKVVVVDSLAASSGYGLLVDKMAELRNGGMGIDELAVWAEEHRLEVQHWFFSTDLTFFIRGGRISKTAGFFGNMLKICPLMSVEADGSLAVKEKIRTKKKAAARVVELMEQLADGRLDYDKKVFISNSACLSDAEVVSELLEKKFAKIDGSVQHFDIGATIGCHTGPGTVAVFFWGDRRTA